MKPVVLKRVEWLGGNEIRVFFVTGLVLETKLPWCRDARRARVIDFGMGLKFGRRPGDEVSARGVAQLPGVVLRGRRPKPMSH
jgi:hypothetical protein